MKDSFARSGSAGDFRARVCFTSAPVKKDLFVRKMEARLDVELPLSYCEALLKRGVYTSSTWEILPPEDVHTCRKDGWEGIHSMRGIVVGYDPAGNPLMLLRDPELERLGDAAWMWDHETRKTTKVAEHFGQLFGITPSLESQGSRLLKSAGKKKAGTAATPIPEQSDAATERRAHVRQVAETLLDAVIASGGVELDDDPGDRELAVDATFSTLFASDRDHAARLIAAWIKCPGVAEVFAEEADVTRELEAAIASSRSRKS